MKQNKVIRPGKCSTARCKNIPKGKKTHCETCRKRLWRKDNIAKDSYQNLKSSAAKRGIPFDLSFEDFLAFAEPCKYLVAKGRHKDGLTVGRKNENPALGYHGYRADNIEPQTLGENVKHYRLQYDYIHKEARYEPRYTIREEERIF